METQEETPVPSIPSVKSDQPGAPNVSNDLCPGGSKKHFDSRSQRAGSPVPSCDSVRGDVSMDLPINLSGTACPKPRSQRAGSPVPSYDSWKSDISMDLPNNFIGSALFKPSKVGSDLTEDQGRRAVCHPIPRGDIEELKASLKKKFEFVPEEMSGNRTLLNNIFTKLYITEGESEGVNKEHEVWQLEMAAFSQLSPDKAINCNDIFKSLPGQQKHIRTVLTKGIAGIGKTVSVQKFVLDWAEGKANQDIDFMFVLPFREINLIKDNQYNLHELLNVFHHVLKNIESSKRYEACKVVFVFDGLDESKLPLDFHSNKPLSDVTETSSVDVLMTNLIKGNLLPNALVWITSRPAAANQIPHEYVNQVTEVRGFSDPQKEEYFRKRFDNEEQAKRIFSFLKTSRSLHIMCHIPVFCRISATVFQDILGKDESREIPKTLTEMYAHFLITQTKRKNLKYHGRMETDPQKILESDKEVLLKLGKLAFQQLDKGNILFYEEDLRQCDIDVNVASVCTGVCTEIFQEETVFHLKKVYCFVHLSIQEFLSAVYVFHCYKSKTDELKCFIKNTSESVPEEMSLYVFMKSAMENTLRSKNGHLDLFLRFLHGILMPSNQSLLRGLLPPTGTEVSAKCLKSIKCSLNVMQSRKVSAERCINLFHCLIEMNDQSVYEVVQKLKESGRHLVKKLTLAQCSALAYVLLMSGEVMEEFDLRKYNTSNVGRRRLLAAVRSCRKALLTGCELTEKSCGTVAFVLQSPNSLSELDMSYNNLPDAGVKVLSAALMSEHCKLVKLRLSFCKLSVKSCAMVASALKSTNSLTELDLRHNPLLGSGVEISSAGLMNLLCNLETLRLAGCKLSQESFETLALVLQSQNSLRQLDLTDNDLHDSGVRLLSPGLMNPNCKLETLRLAGSKLTKTSCEAVASVLRLPNSLTELDLSYNDLEDSGVELLSAGLASPNCKVETLRLSACLVSVKGCASLALALSSNPSHLRELDLSYNHPRDSGLEDPLWKLDKLKVNHHGECRLRSILKKYACDLTLDPNTVHKKLSLGEENRMVQKVARKHRYPNRPERFQYKHQVVCREALKGLHYWEVEWSGEVSVGVTYERIGKKGEGPDCGLGQNDVSWCLYCSDRRYAVWHGNKKTKVALSRYHIGRVGVYLDWAAGTLSFYRVSSDTLTHIHTFKTTFTEPLYPAFRLFAKDNSVSLCQVE